MRQVDEAPLRPDDRTRIHLVRFQMASGERFERHVHDVHQLAWSPSGVIAVETDDTDHLVLGPSRALWIPAGTPHVVDARRAARLQSLYFHPARCRIAWTAPTVVSVSPLLEQLIAHLRDPALAPDARERAELVVPDALTPVAQATVGLRMPSDPRALDVATALVDDPGDDRTLDRWGRHVGASSRTLARLFLAETGLTFPEWRTHARVRAAMVHLAAGTPSTTVAHLVGYRHASAFVAAFHRVVGRPPGAYFADLGSETRLTG